MLASCLEAAGSHVLLCGRHPRGPPCTRACLGSLALTVDALAAGGAAGAGASPAAAVLQSPSAHCAALLGVVDLHAVAAHERGDRTPEAPGGPPPEPRRDNANHVGARGPSQGLHRAGIGAESQQEGFGGLGDVGGAGAWGRAAVPTRFLEVRLRRCAGGGGGAAGMAEGWARARPPTVAVALQVAGLEARPRPARCISADRACVKNWPCDASCLQPQSFLLSYLWLMFCTVSAGTLGGAKHLPAHHSAWHAHAPLILVQAQSRVTLTRRARPRCSTARTWWWRRWRTRAT